jgi:hypothetical protein
MAADGNLVIRNGSNEIQKHTNTAGYAGAVLKVLDDGSLVIVHGNTVIWDRSMPLLTPPPTGDHVLSSGASLSAGDTRVSANLRYLLAYQGDGNVVLYDTEASPWEPVWDSSTVGTLPGVFAMQGDGNLVLYDANGDDLGASGTQGNNGAYLVVTDDGRLIIYTADHTSIWDSSTDPF